MNPPANPIKPRTPWLAALLSLLQPGLGHLYVGRLSRALIVASLGLLLAPLHVAILSQSSLVTKSLLLTTALGSGFAIAVAVDCWRIARKEGKAYQLTLVNRWAVYVPFCLLMAIVALILSVGSSLILKQSFEAFTIPPGTASMQPNLGPGDMMLAERDPYLERDPVPGEIIVFRQPSNRQHFSVKRIVAGPGQTIAIQKGQVLIDGEPIARTEPETDRILENLTGIQYSVSGMDMVEDFAPLVVPDYHVFVLGDNRSGSRDSRHFGPIQVAAIYGKASDRYWPPQRTGQMR